MNKVLKLSCLLGVLFLISATSLEKVELAYLSLLEDKVELKVPTDFSIMSEEMANTKYPAANRPTIIYTNESGSTNVALNFTQNACSQKMISPYHENFMKTFKNLYPSAEWKECGVEKVNGKKIGVIEFIVPAVDTEIYNLMFFTDVEDKLLLCTFNCTKEQMGEWSPIAHEILQSLKVKK